jgi:tRNA A37 N6-isopentenylltransferase MiaA
MFYDVAHRHHQALDPSALITVGTALHALERAIEDCRNAGKSLETDPGVLLLARRLGEVATTDRPTRLELRRSCMDAIADIGRKPALAALARRGVANDARAKATFHAEAKRALRRLAEALGLENGAYDVRSELGHPASSGEITLEAAEVQIQVALWPMATNREVTFRRIGTGKLHWASVHELLTPARFAARLRRELRLAPASTEPSRLFA